VEQSSPEPATGKTTETVKPRTSMFIEIVEESQTFDWCYTDGEGVTYTDTKFTLRILPEGLDRQWRKELTRKERDKGQVREVLNWDLFSQKALAYCVINITGLRHKGQELKYDPKYLVLLPERIKAAIIRLCVGKEAGLEAATTAAEDEHPNG
jgi:hypothetical protein